MNRPPMPPTDEPLQPRMVKIAVDTPGCATENMWFELAEPSTARLRNIPVAATWLVFDDLVLLGEAADGRPTIEAILRRSHADVVAMPATLAEAERAWNALRHLGATSQRLDDDEPAFVAAVPRDRLVEAEQMLEALGVDAEVQPAEPPPPDVAVLWLQ